MKKGLLTFSIIFYCLNASSATAIFAGGCFWCTQKDFDLVKGVTHTEAGYDGGYVHNPYYHLVASGSTHYVESVKVTYDPSIVSYKKLVQYFFTTIDYTQNNGQFCDIGRQYRSVIFYQSDKQKQIAQQVKTQLAKYIKPVVTDVSPSTTFYSAETYHQKYYKKNPIRYKFYRYRCGRDQRRHSLKMKLIHTLKAKSHPELQQ